MKVARRSVLALFGILALLCTVAPVHAQEKNGATAEVKKVTPIKVTIVISEMDGTKKISSLPYTLYVNADDVGAEATTRVRIGVRVPVATRNGANGEPRIEYMDFDTNMDCKAYATSDGRFKLGLSMDRNIMSPNRNTVEALASASDNKKSATTSGDGASNGSPNPVMEHFTSAYNLIIRDGQTIDATSTTDPLTGRVLVVSVTANAVK
jgi:hypothetical protein